MAKKRLTAIERIEQRVAADRERDLERVRRGEDPARIGRENGAFGHAIAERGQIDWQRAARAF